MTQVGQSAPEIQPVSITAACRTCHGEKLEGNTTLKAPSLTNLESIYMERQLLNFKNGIRGADPKDIEGNIMRIATLNYSDQDIKELVRTISALPSVKPGSLPDEDAGRGKAYYDHLCGACHGPSGKGIKAIGAPGLWGLEDWYMASQLEKFRSGIRGSSSEDRFGQQMVYIMKSLNSEAEIKAIIAYLQTVNVESR